MSVAFNTIPAGSGNLVPLFYNEFSNAAAGQNNTPQRALLIGQSGNVASLGLQYCPSKGLAAQMYGNRSMLAGAVAGYRAADPVGELWCLDLPDASGATAATGSILFAGSPTANASLALYIAGVAIPVALTAGMTAAEVATAVAAAISAVATLPVTAAVDGVTAAKVDVTAFNKGLVGNSIDIRLNNEGAANGEVTPAGLTVTITAMSGGATDPDLGGVSATLGSQPFDFIGLTGYTSATDLTEMDTMMSFTSGRWSYSQQIYGHVFTAKMGTETSGADLLTFGETRNGPHVTVVGYEPSPTPPWVVAASFMGAFAVSSKADPARPVQTLAVPGVLAPPADAQFDYPIWNSLLGAGIAPLSWQQDGSAQIMRAVTTYQLNASGAPDQSYLDAETLYTLAAIVRALKGAVTQKFGRSKLAQDGTNFGAGQAIVTPNIVRAELIAQYTALEGAGLVQDTTDFAAGLDVEINADNASRLDVLFDPYLVSGLRMFAMLTQFALQAPAS